MNGDEILSQLRNLRRFEHSDYGSEEETRRKLNQHGINDDEIRRQLSELESNTAEHTGVLTSYSLLHSLQHLDAINRVTSRYSGTAEAILTVFRSAEIAIGCLGELAARMHTNLESGRMERVVANARWRAGLHELLYRLSAMIVEISASPESGFVLQIDDSPAYQEYRNQTLKGANVGPC